MPRGNVDQNGNLFVTADNFDTSPYGTAPYDPEAPFGSAASVPPPSPMSDPSMSLMPGPEVSAGKWGPGPTPGGPPQQPYPEVPAGGMTNMSVDMSGSDQVVSGPGGRAPVEIAPVTVQGQAPMPAQDPLEFMRRGQAPATPEQHAIADTMGYKWQGGQKAREAIDPYWQNAQRAGLFDPTRANALERQGFEGQRDAQWQATGAQLQANDAEVEALQRREQQLDDMRQQAASKERAMREQVDRDRVEYEGLKREYRDKSKEQFLASVPNALSTMFGMLAIGLAAKGTRENLNATIASVNGQIDRNVQAMRAQTAAKGQDAENAYARFMKSYGNAEQAEAATKSLLTERAQAEIDRMRQQSKDPLIQANGQQAIAELDAARKRYQAEMDVASQGKTAQAWNLGQQARAGSSGGYRAMTADEQRARSMANTKLEGENLGNQKTLADVQKTLNEGSGVATKEDLKSFQAPLSQLTAANDALAKTRAAIDAIRATAEGENFAGMDETSVTPLTAATFGAVERKLSTKAAQQQSDLDGIIDAKTLEAFGSSTPEQRQTVADRLVSDGSKQGTLRNLERMAEESERKIQELKSQLPAGVEAASNTRRQQTGASQNTTTQPGRAIPIGNVSR